MLSGSQLCPGVSIPWLHLKPPSPGLHLGPTVVCHLSGSAGLTCPSSSTLVNSYSDFASDFQVSGYASILHPSGTTGPSFPPVPPLSSIPPALPQSAEPPSPSWFLEPAAPPWPSRHMVSHQVFVSSDPPGSLPVLASPQSVGLLAPLWLLCPLVLP